MPGSTAETAGTLKAGDKVLAFGVPGNLTDLRGKTVEDLVKYGTGVIGAPEAFQIQRPGESAPREVQIDTGYVSPEMAQSVLATINEVKAVVQAAGLNPDAAVAIFSPFNAGETTLAPVFFTDFYATKRLLEANRGKLIVFAQLPANSVWRISWPALVLPPAGLAHIAARPINEQITFHPNGTVHLSPSINRVMKLGDAIQTGLWWREPRLSSPIGADLAQAMRLVIKQL
jgi:hypothetical protein